MRSIRTVLFVSLALVVSFVSTSFAATMSDVASNKNAVLEGDVLTINSKVAFTADGAEIRQGKVVLSKTGKTWEFELSSNQEVDLVINKGVFKLTPLGVGKYASLRKQDDVPALREKTSKKDVPVIADKATGKGNIDLSSLSLRRSKDKKTAGAKKTTTTVVDTTATENNVDAVDVTVDRSVLQAEYLRVTSEAKMLDIVTKLLESVDINDVHAVQRALFPLDDKGFNINLPETWGGTLRVKGYVPNHPHGLIVETIRGITITLPYDKGAIVSKIDGNKKGAVAGESSTAKRKVTFKPGEPATIWFPSRLEKNRPHNFEPMIIGQLRIVDLSDPANLSKFGSVTNASPKGLTLYAARTCRINITELPAHVEKVDHNYGSRVKSKDGRYIGEDVPVDLGKDMSVTIWYDVPVSENGFVKQTTTITDVNGQEVAAGTKIAIKPTKPSHLRSMFFACDPVNKAKKQWITQVAQDSTVYVPKKLGKYRVVSVNYDNGTPRGGVALPGQHFDIAIGGQCTWNFNHAVNP